MEVLGKETFCDLFDLVDIHIVEHPINPLSCMELGLGFLFVPIVYVVPIICMVPTIFIFPISQLSLIALWCSSGIV